MLTYKNKKKKMWNADPQSDMRTWKEPKSKIFKGSKDSMSPMQRQRLNQGKTKLA